MKQVLTYNFLGAIAERVNLSAYIIFALVHTGFVYPFPAHWMWGENGWLSELGAYDFAGSGVVHLSGGIAAFVACILIGPRRNRFGAEKDRYYMASPTNVVLGTFFLWWGWIGFNAGSTFKMSGGKYTIKDSFPLHSLREKYSNTEFFLVRISLYSD